MICAYFEDILDTEVCPFSESETINTRNGYIALIHRTDRP